jgi:hypothetical protein
MFRFIFTLIIGYIILKIIRIFIDPLFQTNKVVPNSSNEQPLKNNPTPKKEKPNLGEYIEYEEVN